MSNPCVKPLDWPTPTRRFGLRNAVVEFTPHGAWTAFRDLTGVAGCPHWEDPHYRLIADRLGYGDDVLRYCQEHEFLHSWLAEVIFDRPSPVLSMLAHGREVPIFLAVGEECLVQTFQRYLRCGEEPIVSGVNWPALRDEAAAILD